MNNLNFEKSINKITSKRNYIFNNMPMWKAILVCSLPSILTMIFFGGYIFTDSVFSINFGVDSYQNNMSAQILGLKNFVRLVMAAISPINILIISLGLFFGLGISIRVSVNLGANKKKEAIQVLKTGFQFAIITSVLLILILYFVSPIWIDSQYPRKIFGDVSIIGQKYVNIFIFCAPFMILTNVFTSLFILEGRSKEMLFAMVCPILLNLFLDWLFMGPMSMGVEGGALATVLSNIISVFLFLIFMFVRKSELLQISNFFGSFKFIAIIGILLIGLATFIRYFSLSIMQTTQFEIMKDISPHIYKNKISNDVNQILDDYINAKPGDIHENFRIINGGYYALLNSDLFNELKSLNNNEINIKLKEFKDSLVHINSETITQVNNNVQDILDKKIISFMPPSLLTSESNLKSLFKKININLFLDKSVRDLFHEQLTNIISRSRLSIYASGAFPILTLLFPVLFGFIQGSVPIMSYNFGAKNFDRVKKGYLWNIIYSLLFTIFIYFLGAFIIVDILFDILSVTLSDRQQTKTILKIILFTIPMFSVGISGMVLLASTDYIILSSIASSLNGIILFFPIQYIMKSVAIKYNEISWLYFLSNPIGAFLTSIIITFMIWFVLNNLKKTHITFEQRIIKMNHWIQKRFRKNNLKRVNDKK